MHSLSQSLLSFAATLLLISAPVAGPAELSGAPAVPVPVGPAGVGAVPRGPSPGGRHRHRPPAAGLGREAAPPARPDPHLAQGRARRQKGHTRGCGNRVRVCLYLSCLLMIVSRFW